MNENKIKQSKSTKENLSKIHASSLAVYEQRAIGEAVALLSDYIDILEAQDRNNASTLNLLKG